MPSNPPYNVPARVHHSDATYRSLVDDDNGDGRHLLSPDTPDTPSTFELTAYKTHNTQVVASPISPTYGSQARASPALPQTHENDSTCRAQDGYRKHHGTWTMVTILLLSIYSTIFSAIWVSLAIAGPAYDFIGLEQGYLNPMVASTLVAAFAKSIELSFATVFVAFLGQFLSRKALKEATSSGITLADMQLRSFLLQPGLILSSWHSFHYTARTVLGVFTIVAAFVSLFYTTASDALVSPKSGLKHPEDMTLSAMVRTDFANNTFIVSMCPTPIDMTEIDAEEGGRTCSGIEHAGQSYHNYLQWLSTWENHVASTDSQRPRPIGMLFDNTTAHGQWLYNTGPEILKSTESTDRLINNVTMALPHSAVYAAVMNSSAMRMTHQDDMAEIRVKAQVVAPAINVLCVSLTRDELKPFVFSEWPEVRDLLENDPTLLDTEWPNYPFHKVNRTIYDQDWRRMLEIPAEWANTSRVDDIFGFGAWNSSRPPPAFPRLPKQFQSVYNFTSGFGADSTYVLFHANDSLVDLTSTQNHNFTMCSLSMSTEQHCSTLLTISMSGGRIELECDPGNPLAYTSSVPPRRGIPNWVPVATDWGTSIALNLGITGSDAQNARLLSQFIPHNVEVDPEQPTLAEALAVLAACTALISTIDAPINHDFLIRDGDRSFDILDHLSQPQDFKASLQVSAYMSGKNIKWQCIFSVILAIAFLINCFCLVYFLHIIRIKGLVNDFIEPQNMFALALNSPSDRLLAGRSASGPERDHMRHKWYIKEDRNHQILITTDRRRGRTSYISH